MGNESQMQIVIRARNEAEKALKEAQSQVNALGNQTKSAGARVKSAFSAVGKSAIYATAGITAVAAVLRPFLDDAIKRVDTFNNFPKVMANMGISSSDASKALKKVDKGIRGLPTALDDATLSVQRLTTRTQDVDKAADIFLALNNAVVAGGAPMQLQAAATEQFSQAFAKGKPDMMEWRSMVAAMPAQLNQLAKSMNIKSVDKLGEKLREGEITMGEFSEGLIKLNSKGVGGLPSLAEQAKNATGGLSTAMKNARIAVARGIAGVIEAIGSAGIAKKITEIGKTIEKVFKFIAKNVDSVAVFVGVILAGAFITLAIAVAKATWPILLIAAAFTGLYLLYKKFQPQIQMVIDKFKEFWKTIQPIRDFVAGQFKLALEDLKSAWEDIREAIEPYMPQLKQVGKWLAIVGAVLTGVFVAAIVITILAIARFVGWIAKAIAKFQEIRDAIVDKVGQIKGKLQEFKDFVEEKLVQPVRDAKAAVEESMERIEVKIGSVVDSIKSKWQTLKTTFSNVVNFFNQDADTIVERLNGLEESFNSYSDGVIQSWKGQWESLKNSTSEAWEGIKTSFTEAKDSLVDSVSSIWESIKTSFSSSWESLKTSVTEGWEGIKERFREAKESIKTIVSDAIEGVKNSIKNMFKPTGQEKTDGENVAKNFVDSATSQAGSMESIRKIGDAVAKLIGAVALATMVYFVDAGVRLARGIGRGAVNALRGVKDRMIGYFATAGVWLIEKGKAVVRGLKNGITSMGNSVWSAIKSVSDKIGSFFSGAGRWLWDTGRAIIDGLTGGIKSAIGSVKETLGSLTSMIPDWKGPMETDKKLLTKSGEAIMEGLNSGFRSKFGDIQSTLSGLTADMTVSAATGTSRGAAIASQPSSAGSGGGNVTVNFYGNVTNSTAEASNAFWDRLDRNAELAAKGAPARR